MIARRIVHVIASLTRASGGPALAAVELARAGADKGHHVDLIAVDQGETVDLSQARAAGVRVHLLPPSRRSLWQRSAALSPLLDQLLPGSNLVHLHSLYLHHVWATALACGCYGVPFLLRPHGSLAPYLYRPHALRNRLLGWAFQDQVFRQAAAIHCTSSREAQQVLALYPGLRTEVLPLGLDLAPFTITPPREVLEAQIAGLGAAPFFLFLGRLHQKKGIDLLLRSFAQSQACRNFKLVVAGPDDGVGAASKALAGSLGLGARVFFPGLLSGPIKQAALAHARAFVLPSQTENFGLAVLEALASATPVLVSDQVDIAPEIQQGEAGLVTGLDQGALVAALDLLAGDDALCAHMAGQASILAAQFSKERLGEGLDSLYRALVKKA